MVGPRYGRLMTELSSTFTWSCRALVAAGVGSILVGVVLIAAAGSPLFRSYDASVARAFYASEELPAVVLAHHHWLLGVIGASIVGWGIAFVALVAGPFRRRERWAWNTLALSVAVWGSLDAGVSVVHGVTGEVAFVATVMACIAVPLALTRRAFS